jgi:hypothetical protein
MSAPCVRNRDRGRPRGLPLPHHRTYGSVSGGSLDQARAMFRAGAEGSDGVVRCVGFGPFEQRVRASPFPVAAKAILEFGRMADTRSPRLRVLPTFRPSAERAPPTMPSADFCAAVGPPYGVPSLVSETTAQISRGKTDRLRRTPAGFTTPVLDGRGLRDHLLARPTG